MRKTQRPVCVGRCDYMVRYKFGASIPYNEQTDCCVDAVSCLQRWASSTELWCVLFCFVWSFGFPQSNFVVHSSYNHIHRITTTLNISLHYVLVTSIKHRKSVTYCLLQVFQVDMWHNIFNRLVCLVFTIWHYMGGGGVVERLKLPYYHIHVLDTQMCFLTELHFKI